MNVLIIYKTQTYNIKIQEDISIINLKNLVSKKIQRNKTSFDLYYNNEILLENESSLYQITEGERNIRIIVLLKRHSSINKMNFVNIKKELPFLALSSRSYSTNRNDDGLKLNLDETENISNSSTKDLNKYTKLNKRSNITLKAKQQTIKYTTRNKVFEDIYNAKEENIIDLLKELKNKILEYDNILYRNNKNGYDNNNKLLIYEKNVINYKDKQIVFLKKLLTYFDGKEASSFSDSKLDLQSFYQDISNFTANKNENTFIQSYTNKKQIKIIKGNKNIKSSNFSEVKLPKISINNNIEDNSPINGRSFDSEDSSFNYDDIIKEKNAKISANKEQKKNGFNKKKLYNNFKNNTEGNIDISYDTTPNETNLNRQKEKKLSLKRNSQTNQIEESCPGTERNLEELKDDKNIGIFNSCKNIKNPKYYTNNDNPKRLQLSSSKSVNTYHNETEHNYDSNRISALFEIEERKHENSEQVSDNDSDDDDGDDNLFKKKIKRKEIIERNLKDRRITLNKNSNNIKDSRIGYRIKLKDRITTHRIKKLGNVYSDFVI